MAENDVENPSSDFIDSVLPKDRGVHGDETVSPEGRLSELPKDVQFAVRILAAGRASMEKGVDTQEAKRLYNDAAQLLPGLIVHHPEYVTGLATRVMELDLTEVSSARAKTALSRIQEISPETMEVLERDRSRRDSIATEELNRVAEMAEQKDLDAWELTEAIENIIPLALPLSDLSEEKRGLVHATLRKLYSAHPESTLRGIRKFYDEQRELGGPSSRLARVTVCLADKIEIDLPKA